MNSEDVVRKWFAAYNRHDVDGCVAMLDPDYVEYSPTSPEPVKGREPSRKASEAMFKAFPDYKNRILNIIAKGDLLAVEWVVTGTFKGVLEFAGRTVLPTGGHFEHPHAAFYRINSKGLFAEATCTTIQQAPSGNSG
jgi:ketosteroid isomerase-like protein